MKATIRELLLFWCIPALLWAADSTRTTVADTILQTDTLQITPADSTAKPDTAKATPALPELPPAPPPKPIARLTPVFDSLLALLYGTGDETRIKFDLPQESSRFLYDPLLFRLSPSYWGELESDFPAGLSPTALSATEPIMGDESFADPVPTPGSEEFIRLPLSDGYDLLSPTLSGSGSPFGRPFVLYQKLQLTDSDTSRSAIDVIHGTGGFSNTTFTFENSFGPAGIVNADGTFLKKAGANTYSTSKLSRLRLVSRPNVARNVATTIAYTLNRLNADKLLFAPTGLDYGNLSDNYSAVIVKADYLAGEKLNYRAALAYRNDDQHMAFTGLNSHQRFRIVDGHLVQQVQGKHQTVLLGGDLRYLNFYQDGSGRDALYYNITGSDLLALRERLSVYGDFSLRGSNELRLKPAATLGAIYRLDSLRTVSVVASRSLLLPQPEMLYLGAVNGALGDTTDYRISGNQQLEMGYANNIEAVMRYDFGGTLATVTRVGFSNLHDLPDWRAEYGEYVNGDYRPVAVDRNLFFTSLTTALQLPHGFYGRADYGFRTVYEGGVNYTAGPQHSAAGYFGWRFPVRKFKIWINAAVGGRVRSTTDNLIVGDDNARALTEMYLSFDLKSFHFFYDYANLLDVGYYLGGYRQPGRAIWWGFTWAFID